MSGRTLLGVILILVGVLALVYQGFTYTTHKKVLDIGPIQATKTEHHSVPMPPVPGRRLTPHVQGPRWCQRDPRRGGFDPV